MEHPSPSRDLNSTIVRPAAVGFALLRLATGMVGRLAPGLAARWAARLFLRTRRFAPDSRERKALEAGQRVELRAEGRTLAAWTWGHGPTVALVHGWEGRGSQLAGLATGLASAGYRAVAFDAPGHGASPGARSSLVGIARGLEGVAASWGPLAGVVAHSAGAVAATFALSRGLPAGRAVFIAPGTDLEDYARLFARFLGLTSRVMTSVRWRVEEELGVSWRELEPLRLAPSMKVPLQVVADAEDWQTPLEGAEALAREWPGARLVTTRGLGHHRILWAPEVIQGAVDFLTGPPVTTSEVKGTFPREQSV
jgi:pimeloyl-ACP methyl ester carboxylesterase